MVVRTPPMRSLPISNTFVRVQTNSERVWKWQWYCLVEEYIDRPVAVPPFIVISHMVRLIAFLWRKYKGTEKLNQVFHATSDYAERNTRKDHSLQRTNTKTLPRYFLEKTKYKNVLVKKESNIFCSVVLNLN